ncbi:MAG: hypothetical protein KF799_07710 [Bdellovibrionales bacterium]|nr:hypothetical protein [Bdellovibrionales bacterium]
MKSLLFVVVFLSVPAFAVENLGCEGSLRIERARISHALSVPLSENDVVWHGNLYTYRKRGMAGQIGWAFSDRQARALLPLDAWVWSRILRNGDRIFAVDQKGRIQISGYFQENPGRLNTPELYRDPEFTQLTMAAEEFRTLFRNGISVTVIQRLTSKEKAWLKLRFDPLFARQRAHLEDRSHFVVIGDRLYERGQYEIVLRGHVEVKWQNSGHKILLVQNGESTELAWKDRLFLLNNKGQVFLETLINLENIKKIRAHLAQSTEAVIVRSSVPAR